MELSEQQLAIIASICVVLLLCLMSWTSVKKCCKPKLKAHCPKQHIRVSIPRPFHVEGSVGPTPYRDYGIRSLGKTEHFKNKTRVLWQSAPSQANVDEMTGTSLNKVSSEFITPLRFKKTDQQVGRPRMRDAIPSHV